MNNLLKFVAGAMLITLPSTVSGAEIEKGLDPLEPVPVEGVPDCPWSKLNSQELKACQEKKQILTQMTKEQRVKWNEEVEKRQLERRLRRIERIVN